MTQKLNQGGCGEGATRRRGADRFEVAFVLDENVEFCGEARSRRRQRNERQAHRRAGKQGEHRRRRRDLRERRISREVDNQKRSANEWRVRLQRERRAKRQHGFGERDAFDAYVVPSSSSARTTRLSNFPVSL